MGEAPFSWVKLFVALGGTAGAFLSTVSIRLQLPKGSRTSARVRCHSLLSTLSKDTETTVSAPSQSAVPSG